MLNISKSIVALSVAGVLALAAAPAAMAEKGDWIIKGGATMVDPKSDNLKLGDITDDADVLVATDAVVNVDDATSFGFTITYMFTDNFGVELLAAYPFTHDIDLCLTPVEGSRGCVGFAETDHLPGPRRTSPGRSTRRARRSSSSRRRSRRRRRSRTACR